MGHAQAHMCQGLGQHVRAVELLTQALPHCATREATIECLFLRGAEEPSSLTPDILLPPINSPRILCCPLARPLC